MCFACHVANMLPRDPMRTTVKVSPGPTQKADAPLPNPPAAGAIHALRVIAPLDSPQRAPTILPPAAKSVRVPQPKYFPLTPIAPAEILRAPAPFSCADRA